MVRHSNDHFYTFVDSAYAQGRNPSSPTEELKDVLYDKGGEGEDLASFSAFLFTHNAKIGLTAFALGVLLGIPTILLMFSNGLVLGAFAALYNSRGLDLELWGWLLPHGVTELLAVILCGGAGLRLAQSLIFPGVYGRRQRLATIGKEAALVAIGCVALFLIAGLIEGVFRQRVQELSIRYGFALFTAGCWLAYFLLLGRDTKIHEA